MLRRLYCRLFDRVQYVQLDPVSLLEGEAYTAREQCSAVVAVHRPDPGQVARARLWAEREKRLAEMTAREQSRRPLLRRVS